MQNWWNMRKKLVRIDPGFYFLTGTAILLIPIRWVFAWAVAVLIHEISHILLLYLLGKKVYEIRIGTFGAKICTQQLSGFGGILCVLAGPIGGALPILFGRMVPRIAICAAILSAVNLLPIYPLDGGRVIGILFTKIAERVSSYRSRRIV